MTSIELESCAPFVNPLINQIIAINKTSLVVINAEDFNINDRYISNYQYINQKFNEIFSSLLSFVDKQNKIYIENNHDKSIFNNKRKIDCIIIGVEAFKNKLNDDNKSKFGELFIKSNELGIINFILVDSIDKIKKIEIESWYKNTVNNNNGINDQFSLKITKKIAKMKEEVPNNFCFVVNKGKVSYVKFVENLELKINK